MPLYEYACRDCHHECELLVRASDEPPQCPDCGSSNLAKLLSVPAATVARKDDLPLLPAGPCGGSCACYPGD